VNLSEAISPLRTLGFRVRRAVKRAVPGGRIRAFGSGDSQIGKILVINLNRQPNRWRKVSGELHRFRSANGDRLSAITHRFPAVDARDGRAVAATADVDPIYRIGDQLYVQPDERLSASFAANEPVRMSPQEVAVARSHIETWKAVASGTDEYVLILEDDAWFRNGAKSSIDRGWRAALNRSQNAGGPKLVYLSYEDAGGTALRADVGEDVFRPVRGLWFLSGYVISRSGAAALLRAMPVVGPVDLWMNYRFEELGALALTSPAIAQRHDLKSENSYSVMPYLARAGVVDGRNLTVVPRASNSGFLIAWTADGEREGLAMALSMLGRRVQVFDIGDEKLDFNELMGIFEIFDAIVDPPLTESASAAVLTEKRIKILLEPNARTPSGLAREHLHPSRSLILKVCHLEHPGWSEICQLLGLQQPTEAFPIGAHQSTRLFRRDRSQSVKMPAAQKRRVAESMDDSPWVIPQLHQWEPLAVKNRVAPGPIATVVEVSMTEATSSFPNVTETFPGNLASFSPDGVEYSSEGARIILEADDVGARPFRSGAFASKTSFTHGRFGMEIRAANGPGLVTGFFLHRASPRQEIDIEFSGSDPRRMLCNVYFNPGDDGTEMAYGYRGSPVWIDLGFDSTQEFHHYAIDWQPDRLAWLVDGEIVFERGSWDPTPIPHLEMRVHANLWAPSSQDLAGRVDKRRLPSSAALRNLSIVDSREISPPGCVPARNSETNLALRLRDNS